MDNTIKIDLFSWFIIFFGIVIAFLLVKAYLSFMSQINEYNKKNNENDDEADAKLDGDDVKLVRKGKGITVSFMERVEDEYNSNCIFHNGLIQIISLFPMLGLLGTVIGLIRMISDKGVEEMTSSIGLALVTTTVGLACAIVLKFIDAVWVSPTSEKVQNIIARHSTELDNIAKKQNIKRG